MRTKSVGAFAGFGCLASAAPQDGFTVGFLRARALWLGIFVSLVCSPLIPTTTEAQVNTWTNPLSGVTFKWEDSTSWSLGTPPNPFQSAIFITNAASAAPNLRARTVNIDTNTVTAAGSNNFLRINNLTVSAPRVGSFSSFNTLLLNSINDLGTVTPLQILNTCVIGTRGTIAITNSVMAINAAGTNLVVDGTLVLNTGSLLTTNGVGVIIGQGATGALSISAGTWAGYAAYLGVFPGSIGTVTISGGTGVLSSALSVAFGQNSTGVVLVTGGQLIVTNGSTSLGSEGSGQLTVSGGTWLARDVSMGTGSGSQGTLTIAGGTSTLLSILDVGSGIGGNATMWVTGGQLIVTNNRIAIANGPVGSMTVSNGTWLSSDLIVSTMAGSQGTLTIAGGTNTLLGTLDVALDLTATGSVWITGGQLTTTNSTAFIGDFGVGQMAVSNGTWLARSMAVANNPGSQGTLSAAGGTGSVFSNLIIGNFGCTSTGIVNITGGALYVTNATGTAVLDVRSGTLTINSGTLVVDKFVMTNACAHFVQNGGTFLYSNGQPVVTDPPLPTIPTNNYKVTAFGAIGDGVSDNATSIQTAIITAAATGGTVEIPADGTLSTYLCGPINLTNTENLVIDAGATLKMLPMSSWPNASTPFINGSKVHDIEISGSGTIDGQGTNWWFPKASTRPNFINISGCTNILIQGVTLQNPPTFHMMLKGNNVNLTIQGITVNTPFDSPNTDGMDLASSNVLVRSCSISDGDDNIEIGGSGGPVANMTVSNCTFGSGHGVSIGSLIATQFVGDVRGVHDLLVSNCTFNGTEYGIHMKSDRDRGGTVQNARYLDLTMTNVNFPIAIYAYYNTIQTPKTVINFTPADAAGNGPQPVIATTPIWKNITISNVTATAIGGNIAGIILGVPEVPASNIVLRNVNLSAATNTFCIYNATGIQFVDSQLATPSGTNTLTLYNAQVTVTNKTANPNVLTFGGLAEPPTNNVLALFNSEAAIGDAGMLGPDPFLTLAESTLTVSNDLPLGGASTLNFGVGTNATEVAVTGNLTLGGTLNVTDGGGFTNSTYTLFTYGGTLTTNGSPTIMTIGTTPNTGLVYAIDITTLGAVKLKVTGGVPPADPFVAWQSQYFGCTNCAQAQPNADPYGKGISNTNQFLVGLNPTNPASVFRIFSVTPQGSNIVVTWRTAGVRTNALQATSGGPGGSYATNGFADISGPVILPATGDTVTNYLDIGGATIFPARFYRVRLVP